MTPPSRLEIETNEIVAAANGASTNEEPHREIHAASVHLVRLDDVGVSESTPLLLKWVAYSASHPFGHALPLLRPVEREELEALKARVLDLEEEVARLLALTTDEEVIELRDVSKEEAKQEILAMFQSGETLFYSDLATRLRLDLPLVVEVCQELEQEGEIEVHADAI
jgi:cell division protein FtsB